MTPTTTRTRRATTAAAAAVACLALAACGGGDDDVSAADASSEPAAAGGSAMPAESASPTEAMAGQFGQACSQVPADGAGSFAGMATDPVATAASNNPVLSTLVGAVGAAGLGDTLNTAQDVTVFAPVNDAFAAMDEATLDAALADPTGLLTTVLTYHVVPERLDPMALAGAHTTLQGGQLTVEGSGEDFTVNGSASVVCGNVQTANATVYLIDGVLVPPA
jgi:uncharacterized surface protein with fasciclin (FAS1) repeats